jgi:hypothetical protein
MNDRPYRSKARVYFRRKWTQDENYNWVQIPVWLTRHRDGTLQESAGSDFAFTRAHRRIQQELIRSAH